MRYLVTMKPLEPYSFGNDQNFTYPGEKATGKETYFVKSKDIPEQTSILGLLRYLVLQNRGLLRTDFKYSAEERAQMNKHIGERSFSYLEQNKQDFGDIHEISPVFIINEKQEILVRNPFHNKADMSGYMPMRMEDGVETSWGTISLPECGQYDAKKGYACGYFNLKTKEIVYDLFETKVVSGNRKNEKDGSDEGCFFKREMKCLKAGYSFGVYVDAEKLPEKTIGYMGKKKSAFSIEAYISDAPTLEEQVKECFSEADGKWFYALSDLVLTDRAKYEDFCIVEEKYQRNLETVYTADNHVKRLRKSEVRFHLIQSGSVFYKSCNLPLAGENCHQIGYNRIVQLGGK